MALADVAAGDPAAADILRRHLDRDAVRTGNGVNAAKRKLRAAEGRTKAGASNARNAGSGRQGRCRPSVPQAFEGGQQAAALRRGRPVRNQSGPCADHVVASRRGGVDVANLHEHAGEVDVGRPRSRKAVGTVRPVESWTENPASAPRASPDMRSAIGPIPESGAESMRKQSMSPGRSISPCVGTPSADGWDWRSAAFGPPC